MNYVALPAIALCAMTTLAEEKCRIDLPQARVLAANTPEVLQARGKGGCPELDHLWSDESSIAIQVRNRCAKPPVLIGTYYIDPRTGSVWRDIDKRSAVNSPRLDMVRKQLREQARSAR